MSLKIILRISQATRTEMISLRNSAFIVRPKEMLLEFKIASFGAWTLLEMVMRYWVVKVHMVGTAEVEFDFPVAKPCQPCHKSTGN